MESARDLPLMRVRPSFWSIQGPSNTSMTSSTSAFRNVLALPTSNSLVMAIDFTTTKYCCRKARNLRLPIPPVWIRRQMSFACSGLQAAPSRVPRCETKASSEMRSSPFLSSSKSWSSERPRFCTSPRRAVEARPQVESTIAAHLPFTASTVALATFSSAKALPSIFCSSRLASKSGPFSTLATLESCSFTRALVPATASAVSTRRPSTLSMSDNGVGNASSSAGSAVVRGLDASSNLLALSSIASTLGFSSLVMAAASFFSRASTCAFI
mmetsp:Transcript_74465/g.240797  ORF Transcript_74465/g.240797 Transcript_74465/m.240797 type:complete len:270 (-) Transcript_74465:3178-3987(-)